MNERIDWRLTLEYFSSNSSRRAPDKPLPEVNPPSLKAFLRPTDSTRFIWLGHSTLLMNIQNKLDLFDPVFSNSAAPVIFLVQRFQPAVLSLEELPPIDYVVISHDHPVLSREANKVFGPTWNQITPNLLGNSSRAYHRSELVVRT